MNPPLTPVIPSDGTGPARPSGPSSLADRAYEQIRDQLVTLAIAPGAPINEDQLVRDLGFGRTPVREAVKRLALESLVDIYPRRGTFASEIQITDLALVTDVRALTEGHAALRAAQRITAEDRKDLQALLERLAAQKDHAGSSIDGMGLDADVHRFVYRCARNPYLEEVLTRHFNLSLRIWHLVLDRLPDVLPHVTEHVELLRAIDAGEPERAREVAQQHVIGFAALVRDVL